jgi:hypothetical protein
VLLKKEQVGKSIHNKRIADFPSSETVDGLENIAVPKLKIIQSSRMPLAIINSENSVSRIELADRSMVD